MRSISKSWFKTYQKFKGFLEMILELICMLFRIKKKGISNLKNIFHIFLTKNNLKKKLF